MKSCSALFALTVSVLLLSAPATASNKTVDIVGLRLGMTADEAKEAIRKYNPALKIQPPVEKFVRYRVANQTRKTDPFLSYIFAVSGKKQKDDIYVYFSAPPREPRVIAITRLHNNFNPPITRANYRKALVGKYGEPGASEKDRVGDESRRMHWYQWQVGAGKTQCVPHINGGRDVVGPFGSTSASAVERGEVLKRIKKVNDLSDCSALLTYQLNYDPLFSATGTLIDVAGAAKSEQEMSAWIDELVRKGEEKIRGSKGAPKL